MICRFETGEESNISCRHDYSESRSLPVTIPSYHYVNDGLERYVVSTLFILKIPTTFSFLGTKLKRKVNSFLSERDWICDFHFVCHVPLSYNESILIY